MKKIGYSIQALRILFPSWKFFDGSADAPEHFYRLSDDGQTFGQWILGIPKTGKRSWKNLWVNSQENFHFACHALIEYLKNDLEDESDPATSLALLKNLVQFQLRLTGVQTKKFQFLIGFDCDLTQALYVSPVLDGDQ